MKIPYPIRVVFILLIITSGTVSAATIHVPGDYPTIADAIGHALDNDVVLVADGLYTGYGNRNIHFDGKAITVISENVPENCIVDCNGSEAENHRGFHFDNAETAASILSGFTIRNGYCHTGQFGSHGGAILCEDSSPVIENCIIENNHAYFSGGGIECSSGNTTIRSCIFRENTVDFLGAGLYLHEMGTVRDCIFEDNEALGRARLSSHGGGLYCSYDTIEITITGCTFRRNKAEYGGAIATSSGKTSIFQSHFIDNQGYLGGAICVGGSETVVRGAEAIGNTFTGNQAAVGSELFSNNVSDIIDARFNTFAGNSESDYWISSAENFDLTGSTFSLELISNDVYISPNGDDENDGLSWASPFKTIHYAMSRILATPDQPVQVFLGPGIYSPSTTGELFPFPAQSWTTVIGSGRDETILDAENTALGMLIHFKNLKMMDFTLQNGNHQNDGILCRNSSPLIKNCNIKNCSGSETGGLNCFFSSSPVILNCNFTGNSGYDAGGINCYYESSPTLVNCDISGNTRPSYCGGLNASFSSNPILFNTRICNNSGFYSGGLYLNKSNIQVVNSIIAGNTGDYSGAIYTNKNAPDFTNCTITQNTSLLGGAFYGNPTSIPLITNCIIRENSPEEIVNISPEITYSNIQGGYTGEGNIDADPLFVSGPDGYFYLAQTATGHATDSPCVDTGSDLAENICVEIFSELNCLSDTWTRTDEVFDTGQIDMSCHYPLPGIPFSCLNNGDINFDNAVTSGDSQLGFMIVLGVYSASPAEECAADCNGDGSITTNNAQSIFLKAIGSGACAD